MPAEQREKILKKLAEKERLKNMTEEEKAEEERIKKEKIKQ